MNSTDFHKDITTTFVDDPQEEIDLLHHEANLLGLIDALKREDLPEDFSEQLGRHLAYLADMFNARLPEIKGQSPDVVLRLAARDIQVSRILKERGLARLYRLCRSYVPVSVPTDEVGGTREEEIQVFQTLRSPETGESFTTQEDFIGWFARAAHVSRSLIFLRFADLDRLTQGLGLNLEEAYRQLLTKPKVIGDVMRDLADWDGAEIVRVEPEVAKRLAQAALGHKPEELERVERLADQYTRDQDWGTMIELVDAVRPALRSMVEQVALHTSARDAKKMVEADILLSPEIHYSWDPQTNSLVVEQEVVEVDRRGERYIAGTKSVMFMPDSVNAVPSAIIKDLVRRLPIRNREQLDF